MKILITGATGFLGRKISERLILEEHDLVVLSRSAERARATLPFPCDAHSWNPELESPPHRALEGIDAVIHLAGEPLTSIRWSAKTKMRIMDSRVLGTRHLMTALRDFAGPVVSASAIGFYGNRGDEILSEQSASGSDFLAQVCQCWEDELFIRDQKKARTVAFRIGVVLGREGGALERMIPVFRAGLGGTLGNGRQWLSWIHLEDLASLFLRALTDHRLGGPVNAVAPRPVTNREFTEALASALGKRARLTVPALALKAALGEMSRVVLSSQRVRPGKAIETGFEFRFTGLRAALADLFPPSERGYELFSTSQWVPHPMEEVFSFFSKAENLEAITPPWLRFEVLSQSTPELREGTMIDYKLRIHGVPLRWRSRIEQWTPNRRFSDKQLKGPYAYWHHTHVFEPLRGGTRILDRVLYQLPLGTLGSAVAGAVVTKDIRGIFDFRRRKIMERFR